MRGEENTGEGKREGDRRGLGASCNELVKVIPHSWCWHTIVVIQVTVTITTYITPSIRSYLTMLMFIRVTAHIITGDVVRI